MKSKLLLTTVGVACFSLLVGCYGDKEEASSSSSVTPETEMSGSMTEDVKESADAVVESAEEMADEAVSAVEDVVADTVEAGQAAVDDAVADMQEKMSGSDAGTDVEADKLKQDLGAELNKLP